jgi:RHS repeat-associated protein
VNLIASNVSGTKKFYLYNAHGDVVQFGAKVYRYDAFGNELGADENDTNSFRYAGEYFDKEAGTYYLRNRNYNQRNGRFSTEDPIRNGLNFYTYTDNNPVRYIDPSGLKPTVEEAAAMNDHIYNPFGVDSFLWPKVELLGGWEFFMLADFMENQGFVAGIYIRYVDGVREYSIVSKGTDPFTIRDWEQNVDQFLGNSTDMVNFIEYARKFVNNHDEYEVTFVGHSKGGAEAAAGAVATNSNCFVFNPATANLRAYGLNPEEYNASMVAYIVEGEPLNSVFGLISAPIDQVVYLPNPYSDTSTGYEFLDKFDAQLIFNSLDSHAMWGVRKALGDDTGWRVFRF